MLSERGERALGFFHLGTGLWLIYLTFAAVLNIASGAGVPAGVQAVIDDANTWLTNYPPSACTAKGSCGIQKDLAAILDSYNRGLYPGGPLHCSE